MAVTKQLFKLPSLSVFYPCFNEQENLPLVVSQALEILPLVAKKFEIIVVNDGSTDQTKQVAQKLAVNHKVIRVVSHQQNRGYGASVRTGFKSSKYDWIFYTDGDGQFNLEELKVFVKYVQDYQIIVGYRQKRAEGFKRILFARLYKFYIDCLFRVHIKDIDCAFK